MIKTDLTEIEWRGPYRDKRQPVQNNILYIITGRIPGSHIKTIRYIGKTSRTFDGRVNALHHYNDVAPEGREIWIGRILGSRSAMENNSLVSKAEKLLINFAYLNGSGMMLNSDYTEGGNHLKKNFGVINEWCHKNGKKIGMNKINCIPDTLQQRDVIIWNHDLENYLTFADLNLKTKNE